MSSDTEVVIDFEELKQWVVNRQYLKHLFLYDEAKLLTCRLEFISKPFLTAILIVLLSKKNCYFEDEEGLQKKITLEELIKIIRHLLRDFIRIPSLFYQINKDIKLLQKDSPKKSNKLNTSLSPIYIRTDLIFGVRSGGSIGHISGVLNNLEQFTCKPIFFSTDQIPCTRKDIETHVILPANKFWDFNEMPSLFFNRTFVEKVHEKLSGRKISFIYQRYSLNNYSGLILSRNLKVPFVLEYNGSEVWINKHWGKPLKYESLSKTIELLNLQGADIIVVVSKPMKDELLSRGIEEAKILVNPNGVNPEQYSMNIDGSKIRTLLGLSGKIVIGFIGTFGKWHGAEVLAQAVGELMNQDSSLKERVHFLFIGNGVTLPLVKSIVFSYNIEKQVTFTGLVPQEEGPGYLAACDILASPHVPNPDGTPFFGSPTKLFEYMAMGKGIIASDLDQIGEILEHGKTAWLTKPGDKDSLIRGLKTLIDDQQLCRKLGIEARKEAEVKFTWKEHTRNILDKLRECCVATNEQG